MKNEKNVRNRRVALLAGVLMTGIFMFGLAGCGNTQTATDTETDTGQFQETVTVEETQTMEKDSVEVGEFDTNATIEETVLIDQDDIKVTATELTFSNYSAELSITIENNSDKDLSFIAESLGYSCNAINGYMIADGYFNEDVAAGKKTNETVSFSISELQMYGINSIADIEIGIYTTDDDYNNTYYEPKKILTSEAESYDYETDTYKDSVENGVLESLGNCTVDFWDTEQIYSEEGVSIESVALITNEEGEQSFFIEFANESEQMVDAVLSDIAVNDLILYGGTWSSDTINPAAKGIVDIQINSLLDESFQELINVGDICSLSFDLVLEDADNDDITAKERVTITVSENGTSYSVSGTPVLESNGVTLTEIGIVPDEDSSLYAYQIFYIVENGTSDTINAGCDYDSLSINGYMVDFYDFCGNIPAGMTGLLRIDLYEDDVEDIGISSVDDIEEIEFVFTATDEQYNEIVEETVLSEK
ncbi:MAG: hypothetical protein LUF92_09580 [Clostridiales bacterium]|nr:hypothetical protein [Clostridiales bacterium]